MRTVDSKQIMDRLMGEVSKSVIGYEQEVKLLFACLVAGGHALIEGYPGLAKTTLVKAFAKALGLSFSRIQFTPDLLPSDITGSLIFNPKIGDFEVRFGPIFANIVLADEVNRAPPKVQSALLEAMQENQVTIGGKSYELPKPFMIIATQNPVELEGTYPLPEAQLDRFMIRIKLGYPSEDIEFKITENIDLGSISSINTVVSKEDIESLQALVRSIYVDDSIIRYIVNLIRATRNARDVKLGASPRAAQILSKLVRAWALLDGRDYVIPDDVKLLAPYVLNHRIITLGADSTIIIRQLLQQVPTPLMERVLRKS
ncbi:ATPase associated with various cellular activities AAA_3 [Vulcanisaeta moutnovskia 768-28]|uniref:ATPase associated with various cellular activities AAA_3 n=1 Tax=Vulcanisaeta moutnovskia (strain 768-28) TaxID=985053 RepID=F0QY37_VULM7|nr:MoxR family ATPase [Vulcanisaeta moutnovskia]ADY02523.1 ATPase associated with various cellular activities AAA_3 [Vulcanisaeta moutnovskia 768-28]